MPRDTQSTDASLRTLRALIAGAEGEGGAFAREREIMAEAFSHACGHNRLERIGLRWSAALTPSQIRLLATNPAAATGFASHLHRVLMHHLLPGESEMESLPKEVVTGWTAALRMGIQGVLGRRAYLCGDSTGRPTLPQPNETFLLGIQPTIRRAADEFFGASACE